MNALVSLKWGHWERFCPAGCRALVTAHMKHLLSVFFRLIIAFFLTTSRPNGALHMGQVFSLG